MKIGPDPTKSEFIDSGEFVIGCSDFVLKGGIVRVQPGLLIHSPFKCCFMLFYYLVITPNDKNNNKSMAVVAAPTIAHTFLRRLLISRCNASAVS